MIANTTRTPSISASVMVSLSRCTRLIVLLLELTETCQDCKQKIGKQSYVLNRIYYKKKMMIR
jgi:hypothetical protein